MTKLLIQQTFPLGRFHANPWRTFAFDDPYGEWPPSPWRLLRAILSRSFQLSREVPIAQEEALEQFREKLVRAFCMSRISWQLPTHSWRGPGIQQYQPSEFKKVPEAASAPGEKTYKPTKVKDNFWLTPNELSPLFWIFESDHPHWTGEILNHLDDCLARMTYFGRAESITDIKRINENETIVANCILREDRTAATVPVLCPTVETTFAQAVCTTNESSVANAPIPPGTVWKYAERPAITKSRPRQKHMKTLAPTSVLQFAIGGRVFPPVKLWIRITERFRGILLKKIAQQLTGDPKAKMNELPSNLRKNYSLLTGKDINGKRLNGHKHAAFFLIPDEQDNPTRLICYRKEPFSSEEQFAILAAAEAPLAWDYKNDQWQLRLVPLSKETPFPPTKNIFGNSMVWETLIPYVPPLHVFRKNGNPKLSR